MQLLAIMDAAVEAASDGTHVEALLEVHASPLCSSTMLNVS